jgi:hypothetical protein
MRLLNFLVEHLPDAALWLHPPQGLKRQLGSNAVCSTITTVTLPVTTIFNSVTATYAGRDVGTVCTTTVSVNLTTVTSINSLTSTYRGPPTSQSSPPASQSSAPVRQISISLCSELCSANLWRRDNESARLSQLRIERTGGTPSIKM